MNRNLQNYFLILDEYKDSPEMPSENQDNDIARGTRALSEKSSKTIVEDMNTETSALVDQDESDPDFLKHKGSEYTENIDCVMRI